MKKRGSEFRTEHKLLSRNQFNSAFQGFLAFRPEFRYNVCSYLFYTEPDTFEMGIYVVNERYE